MKQHAHRFWQALILAGSFAVGCKGADDGAGHENATNGTGPGASSHETHDAAAPSDAAAAPVVRFLSPTSGATLTGFALTQVEVALPGGIDKVAFQIDEGPIGVLRDVPTQWEVDTLSQPNGEHTLKLIAWDRAGERHEDSLQVTFDNPTQRLLYFKPDQDVALAGTELEFELRYSESDLDVRVDLSQLDPNFKSESVSVQDAGDGTYHVRYPLPSNAREGKHGFSVRAAQPGSDNALQTQLSLTVRSLPELPLVVTGASFVPLGSPAVRTGVKNAPFGVTLTTNPTLLTGGENQLKVSWQQDPDNPADHLVLRADGFSGYFVVPLPDTRGKTEASAELSLRLPSFKAGFDGGAIGIALGILDGLGGMLDWVTEGIAAISVGGDGVQVGLTWDTPVDMDLEITDPAGNVVDFENASNGTGTLDLDSNALCEIDGVNAEHISWKPGDELTGEYQVRVNLYDACSEAEVNWQLTASFCGITETHSGKLTAADAAPGTSGKAVATFLVDCTQRVRGLVQYEKTLPAVGGAPTPTPVPFAPIRIRTASGITTTLAQGVTDRDGRYDLRFTNLDQDDYFIEVEASLVDEARDKDDVFVTVMPNGSSTAHRFKTSDIDGAMVIDRTENVLIKGDEFAGAFNIREQTRLALNWATANLNAPVNRKLTKLPVHWTFDETPSGGTSYFDGTSLNILSQKASGSNGADHDEFDDPVILHEFMHYLLGATSFSGPGGPHSGPVAPDLAFSEGMATLFGQLVQGQPVYLDTAQNGNNRKDLENAQSESNVPFTGTALTDPVSEYLAAGILWDILDTTNESFDHISNEKTTTFKTMFEWIPGATFMDRDSNGVDLVDFLDGFRSASPLPLDPQLACLMNSVSYPYFPSTVMCSP